MGATRVSALAVQIEAIGVAKVKAALREVEGSAGRMGSTASNQYGRAARSIALVGDQAARAGEIGGTGMRKLLTVGGDMAFMFGPHGAILGAMAVTGLAIWNYFDRARQKIEETAKKAREEMRSLRRASATAVGEQISQLEMGDPDAEDPLARERKSILERKRAALQAVPKEVKKVYDPTTNAHVGFESVVDPDVARQLREVNAELDRRNGILAKAKVLLVEKNKLEAEDAILSGVPGPAADVKAEAALKLAQAQKAALERQRDELQANLDRVKPDDGRRSNVGATPAAVAQQAQLEERLAAVNVDLGKKNDLIARATTLIEQQQKIEGQKSEGALDKQIETLTTGVRINVRRAESLEELRRLEAALTAAANNSTASQESQIRATERLVKVREALAETFRVIPKSAADVISITSGADAGAAARAAHSGPMSQVKALPHDDQLRQESIEKMKAQVQPMMQAVAQLGTIIRGGIANTIGSAVYEGFSAAFSGKGLGGIFKAFGKSLLSSIGNIFGQLGQTWLEYGILMTALGQALWNPFTSGPAAIAIGAALMALSGALGATARGGGGGSAPGFSGAGSGGRSDDVTRIRLTATSVADQARYEPRSPVHFTVIGPNDPAAFRQIQQGLDLHERR